MGTRSRIGVMHGDKCKSVYCHWDGYLAHNGRILLENYDSSKANHLVALGDLSVLGSEIGEKHPFSQHVADTEEFKALSMEEQNHIKEQVKSSYEKAEAQGWTTFYGRDRGETGTDFVVSEDFVSFLEQCDAGGVEYYYIMKDGTWYCGDTYNSSPISGKLVPLAEALAEHDIEEAEAA